MQSNLQTMQPSLSVHHHNFIQQKPLIYSENMAPIMVIQKYFISFLVKMAQYNTIKIQFKDDQKWHNSK